jgi:uncharacterized lipoprotein YddW (UPF0748 family)
MSARSLPFKILTWMGLAVMFFMSQTGGVLAETENAFFKANTSAPEYRFLWVTRYQIQTTKDIQLVVERARKYNFNALFVQVCALGEAFYRSEINPWGKGVSENFDPLSEIIRLAHAEGIEVHAWLNAAFVWEQARKLPADERHVLRRHPEWVVKDKRGKTVLEYAAWEAAWVGRSGIYLDPALPEVREHIVSLFLEVAEKYPVDGLHFDYIRYPGQDFGYSVQASTAFQQEYHADPIALVANKGVALSVYGEQRYKELIQAWNLFRCQQIEAIVAEVYTRLQRLNRKILLSAAVVAEPERARQDYFQDWESWLKKGLLDFIVPMSYSANKDKVQQQIGLAVQIAQTNKRGLVAGLGAWQQSPADLAEKIFFVRKLRDLTGFSSVLGVSLFSYDTMAAKADYFSKIRELAFQEKVALPGSSWTANKVGLLEGTIPSGNYSE